MNRVSSATAKVSPVVLIANDQEWTARAVESILVANGYKTYRAHTATETLALAERLDPDVVILDQQLPDFSGTEVCRRLRASAQFGASLPILITTAGPSGRQQRIAAYEAGAWEFYGQPLDAESLLHKLQVYADSYMQVRRLRRAASVDEEFGLYNRSGLTRRATELLADARRNGRSLTCVAWSLAGVADSDAVTLVGQTLREHGRSADAVGRLDTKRFAVVVPGASPEGAEQMVRRFRTLFEVALAGTSVEVGTTVVTTGPTALPRDGQALLDQLNPAMAA